MRVLITGGTGQLGRALQRELRARGHDVIAHGRSELDVTDVAQAVRAVDSIKPECVIHCAALTDTAACERDRARAIRVNEVGASNMARASAGPHGPSLVMLSTNEVFDGAAKAPYRERDVPAPVNAYGGSKLTGEQSAMALHLRHAAIHRQTSVVRTAWLYGDGSSNFVTKTLAAARSDAPLRFVTDEIATPTLADDLANAIAQLVEVGDATANGIFHLTNEGEASRYDWAREILRLAGMDPDRVEPITTSELRASGYDGPRKPPYSVLANTRARALGITLRDWREALADYFERARVTARG